jgi:hypothetical protein
VVGTGNQRMPVIDLVLVRCFTRHGSPQICWIAQAT